MGIVLNRCLWIRRLMVANRYLRRTYFCEGGKSGTVRLLSVASDLDDHHFLPMYSEAYISVWPIETCPFRSPKPLSPDLLIPVSVDCAMSCSFPSHCRDGMGWDGMAR